MAIVPPGMGSGADLVWGVTGSRFQVQCSRLVGVENEAAVRELRRQRFRLADGVVASPQQHRGEAGYHLHHTGRGEFFAIGSNEAALLSLLDGRRSFAEVISLAARALGPQAPTEAAALQFCTRLFKSGVLVLQDDQTTHHAASEPRRRPLWNPFWMQLPLGSPDRRLAAALPLVRWLLHPVTAVVSVGLVVTALLLIGIDWPRFRASAGEVFSRDNWLWLGLAWLGLKLLHESAHGLACKHHGGEVRDVGVILVLLAPMAYVDVTSSWSFRSKWQRMHVAAAGMWAELTAAAIAVIVWTRTSSVETAHLLHNVILMAGMTTLLFNLNPLMRFDGYYLLSDFLGIPNLAPRGAAAVRQCVLRWLCGTPRSGVIETGATATIVLAYGAAAALWRVLVAGGLLLAAAVMFHGAGVLLTLVGLLLWVGAPLWRGLKALREMLQDDPVAVLRGTVFGGSAAALLGLSLAWLPNPIGATAPGVIDFAEASHVRAPVDGFVAEIRVHEGEHVEAGAELFVLANEPLVNELRELEIALRESEVRRLAAVNTDEPGEGQIEAALQVSLESRRRERQQQVEQLSIHAPQAGYVIARRLAERAGGYVRAGEELCVLGDDARKEVVLAVDQPMLRRIAVGQYLQVRTGAAEAVTGELARIRPRAELTAPHPSLNAVHGGPLANCEAPASDSDADSLSLVEPVVDARLTLDSATARRLAAGQLCVASTHAKPESLGVGLYRAARGWMADRIADAEAASGQ